MKVIPLYTFAKFSTVITSMSVVLVNLVGNSALAEPLYHQIIKQLNLFGNKITLFINKEKFSLESIEEFGMEIAVFDVQNCNGARHLDSSQYHYVISDSFNFVKCLSNSFNYTKLLIVDSSSTSIQLCSQLSNELLKNYTTNYGINSYVYVFTGFDNSARVFNLTEIYWLKTKFFCNQISFDCSDECDLAMELIGVSGRRQDFRGVEISGIGFELKEFELELKVHELGNGKVEFSSGFNVDSYEYLRDSLNFSQQHILGTGYPSLAPNGSIVGIGGQVIRGEGDISILSLEMVDYRVKGLQFLHPVEEEKLFAIFKQLPLNIREIFLEPFSSKLWMSLMALWVAVTICVIFMRFILHNSVFGDTILWTFGIISQQGWYMSPRSQSLKLAFFASSFSACIIYYYYSATLVSILSLHLPPIQNFQDILNYKFRIYGENNTLCVKDLLKHFHLSGQNVPSQNSLISIGEAVVYVEFTRSAFIAPFYAIDMKLIASNYSEDFICNTLSRVEVKLGSNTKSGMFIGKGSSLKDVLNYKIIHFMETGIRLRLINKYRTSSIHISCLNLGQLVSAQSPVEIEDVLYGVLIVWVGIIIGLVLAGVEIIWWWLKCKK